MKRLLILLFLASCGKHSMPEEINFNDTDGDQIPDAYETSDFNKYVANITPVGNITAQLNYKQGKTYPIETVIELENLKDISSYSKDLMVKSIRALSVEDYFSQYTLLNVKENKSYDPLVQDVLYAKLQISDKTHLMDLSLISNNKTESLGTFKGSINFQLTKVILHKILNGEAVLALSRSEQKKFALPSQDVTVKLKTYRVFIDDGTETKIYYVSKDLKFEDFLSTLDIQELNDIEGVDLLSTNDYYKSIAWWVRNLNSQDKVLVKDDIKNLSNHYLKGFSRSTQKINRSNGFVGGSLILHKARASKALVKIRASSYQNVFKQWEEKSSFLTGSKYHGTDIEYPCTISHRAIRSQKEVEINESFLRKSLRVVINNQLQAKYKMLPGSDEKGKFWEVQLYENVTKFEIYLENLPANSYSALGIFATTCKGRNRPKVNAPSKTSEGQLNVMLETFVEKI